MMTTKQKAEAWLAVVENFGRPKDDFQIIKALLKEHQALLDASKQIITRPLNDQARHKLMQAIAMCEEQNNE